MLDGRRPVKCGPGKDNTEKRPCTVIFKNSKKSDTQPDNQRGQGRIKCPTFHLTRTGAFFCSDVGDAVNLGSRIEGLNKTYGTHILLSEFSYAQVRGTFPNLREIDVALIRGRETPVRLYELIPDGVYRDLDWLGEFARAYELFHAGQREKAAAIFRTLAESIHDPVSQYYLTQHQSPALL